MPIMPELTTPTGTTSASTATAIADMQAEIARKATAACAMMDTEASDTNTVSDSDTDMRVPSMQMQMQPPNIATTSTSASTFSTFPGSSYSRPRTPSPIKRSNYSAGTDAPQARTSTGAQMIETAEKYGVDVAITERQMQLQRQLQLKIQKQKHWHVTKSSRSISSTSANDNTSCGTSAGRMVDNNLRPILVGYAFGPKKMSTMSVVMAEASKAVSTVVTHFPPHMRKSTSVSNIANGNGNAITNANTNGAKRENIGMFFKRRGKKKLKSMSPLPWSSSSSSPEEYHGSPSEGQHQHQNSYNTNGTDLDSCPQHVLNLNDEHESEEAETETDIEQKMLSNCMHTGTLPLPAPPPLPKITCIFPSSFFATLSSSSKSNEHRHSHGSAFASSSSLEEASLLTATTTSTATATAIATSAEIVKTAGTTNHHNHDHNHTNLPQHLQPMRVCFVPLDLDSPLDEQHGGKFDAILHKMTEDILCKSQLEIEHRSRSQSNDRAKLKLKLKLKLKPLDESERQALKRVGRLRKYKQDHPACCVVDHPTNVQALMSRSDIADTLSECLQGVTTKSGVSVRTPRYQVLNDGPGTNTNTDAVSTLSKQIDGLSSNFQYPFIVKPLIAAGTKQSHKMGVLLGRHGLDRVCGTPSHRDGDGTGNGNVTNGPCLLQEYSNHDGLLFKVYVLGDKVWVFQRPSLPNLPLGERKEGEAKGFVEFDSQRPYPTLDDFGIRECVASKSKSIGNNIGTEDSNEEESDHGVTVAEIRPVADTIRKAFGLELFGFDILVTGSADSDGSHNGHAKEMLVVDVNYFPSYKEVTNFSKILAQYLAQCGIEGRFRSFGPER